MVKETYLTIETAQLLINNPPDIWKLVLESINKLLQTKNLKDILPEEDHVRIKFFVQFWKNKDIKKPEWFNNILTMLYNKINHNIFHVLK